MQLPETVRQGPPAVIEQLPPAGEIGDTLREILAGPEFVTFVPPDSNPLLSRLFGWVMDAISDLLEWILGFLGGGGSGLVTALAVLIPLLALIAAGVVLMRRRRAAAKRTAPDGSPDEPVPVTASEWFGLASERAGRGYLRSAATALYQGFLLTLDQRGTVAFHPSKTPGDYTREIARGYGAGTGAGAGGDFLNSFQGFAFGQEDPTDDHYADLARLAREAGCAPDDRKPEPESP